MPSINNDGIGNIGGDPYLLNKIGITVTWMYPVTCGEPNYFEVVLYTGADPDVEANRLADPQFTTDGSIRTIDFYIKASSVISTVHAAVRGIYE